MIGYWKQFNLKPGYEASYALSGMTDAGLSFKEEGRLRAIVLDVAHQQGMFEYLDSSDGDAVEFTIQDPSSRTLTVRVEAVKIFTPPRTQFN